MCICFFFNDTATTEIYTLSLHDALPISNGVSKLHGEVSRAIWKDVWSGVPAHEVPITSVTNGDRKSTRLNSSHSQISYAVFCLTKKYEPPRASRTSWISRSTRRAGPPST